MKQLLNLSSAQFAWLKKYKAPSSEMALAKSIPFTEVNLVMAASISKVVPLRKRYRGPRHDWMALTCLKKHARAFSVYKR